MTKNDRYTLTKDGKGVVDTLNDQVAPTMQSIVDVLNRNWNQTMRFERYRQEQLDDNIKLMEELEGLNNLIDFAEDLILSYCNKHVINEYENFIKYHGYKR